MSDELQMVEETFEPEKRYVVKDLETLKVISDTTRIRILEMLVEKACTVKEAGPGPRSYAHQIILPHQPS